MAKSESFKTKAAMKLHENKEGKKIVEMEKKMGEKDVVSNVKSSMKGKSAGKKVNKTV